MPWSRPGNPLEPDAHLAGRFFRPRPGRQLNDLAGRYRLLESDLNALYACPDCAHLPNLAGDDWVNDMFSDEEIDDFIRNVKGGKYKEGGIDKKRVSRYAGKLTRAVERGFGKSPGAVDYDTPDAAMLRSLADNVFHFSAAKNRAEIDALKGALVNPETGKLRSFEQFRQQATRILGQFQGSWLRTEYDMAVGASTMAARWLEHSADPDTVLVYRTAGDRRVREEHRQLDGIAKKVGDPFWDTWYPPNGWNCRCDVETTHSGRITEGDAPAGAIDSVPPMFRSNFAKDGLVFPPGHPYFKHETPLSKEDGARLAGPLFFEPHKQYSSGGRVLINRAVLSHQDYTRELELAELAAKEFGWEIHLLPELPENDKLRARILPDVKGNSNPDYLINGVYGDCKFTTVPTTEKNLKSRIEEKLKQGDIVFIKLYDSPSDDMIADVIERRFKSKPRFQKALIVKSDGSFRLYKQKGRS